MADGSTPMHLPGIQPPPKPKQRHHRYTEAERETIRQHYGTTGTRVLVKLLPHLGKDQIRQMGRKLGCGSKSGGPLPDATRDAVDQAIRSELAGGYTYGAAARIARATGRHASYIANRMLDLGITKPRELEKRPWTPAEDALCEQTVGLSLSGATRRFKQAGFARKHGGIARRRIALQLNREDSGYRSTGEVGTLFGVSPKTVDNWIRIHKLSTSALDGGRRLIRDADLRNWILDHPLRIEHRRIPPTSWPWLVELLGKRGPRLEVVNG